MADKDAALALFSEYEQADQEVLDAYMACEDAIMHRSSVVEKIARVIGKEGEKKWTGRAGEVRSGKIVKRVSAGGSRVIWFFKGLRKSPNEQDFTV